MGLGTDILYTAAAAVSSPVWGYKLLRTGKWRTDWRARRGYTVSLPNGEVTPRRRRLLIHAVSVGEVNAIQTLVQRIVDRTTQAGQPWEVVIATTTDTGFARARQLFGPPHRLVRYPLDFTSCVRRFLDAVKPDAVALVELEVWLNFMRECERRGVPVCVVNGRLSARSFGRYKLIAPLVRPSFARLAAAGVQTPDYAARFTALGTPADRVKVLDSMKWDTVQIADRVDGSNELAAAMGIDRTKPVIVAGSTGPGEEKMLIDTLLPATAAMHAQVVLVPRKPERFDEVASLVTAGTTIIRRTQNEDGSRPLDGQRLFLLDTMGELNKAYAFADVALVGRSFLGLYGSDPIQPIALGRPTIIGTHYSDFADVVDAFRSGNGIEITDDPAAATVALLGDRTRANQLAENGRRVILSRQGATDRHVAMLMGLMPEHAR